MGYYYSQCCNRVRLNYSGKLQTDVANASETQLSASIPMLVAVTLILVATFFKQPHYALSEENICEQLRKYIRLDDCPTWPRVFSTYF